MEEPTSEPVELLKGTAAVGESHTTAAEKQTRRGKKLINTTTMTPRFCAACRLKEGTVYNMQPGDCRPGRRKEKCLEGG